MKITISIRDFLKLNDDIDVSDDYADDFCIAYCGPMELTEEGEKEFSDILDLNITVYPQYCEAVVNGIENGVQHMRVAKFFYALAGYCTEESYDKWFRMVEDDEV